MQDASAVCPVAVPYFPSPQAVHDESAVCPVATPYLPSPQSVHTADPVDALYFPATQSAHVPPSGPLEPALQVQLVKTALPASELEADGQARHVELASAPTDVEYVPAPQSVH